MRAAAPRHQAPPARRRHHVGRTEPLPSPSGTSDPRRAITAACATPACRSSAASISPGSMRKPRSFTCASARPRKSSTPSRTPARQVAGAVHPAARRPERIGHEPLRRQPRAPQIAPRQTRARDVQLARNASRNRLQADRPARRPACSRSDGRSAPKSADRGRSSALPHAMSRSDRRFGRSVEIDHRRADRRQRASHEADRQAPRRRRTTACPAQRSLPALRPSAARAARARTAPW